MRDSRIIGVVSQNCQCSYKLLSVDEDTIESAKIFFDRNAPEDSLKIVKYTLKLNLTDE